MNIYNAFKWKFPTSKHENVFRLFLLYIYFSAFVIIITAIASSCDFNLLDPANKMPQKYFVKGKRNVVTAKATFYRR